MRNASHLMIILTVIIGLIALALLFSVGIGFSVIAIILAVICGITAVYLYRVSHDTKIPEPCLAISSQAADYGTSVEPREGETLNITNSSTSSSTAHMARYFVIKKSVVSSSSAIKQDDFRARVESLIANQKIGGQPSIVVEEIINNVINKQKKYTHFSDEELQFAIVEKIMDKIKNLAKEINENPNAKNTGNNMIKLQDLGRLLKISDKLFIDIDNNGCLLQAALDIKKTIKQFIQNIKFYEKPNSEKVPILMRDSDLYDQLNNVCNEVIKICKSKKNQKNEEMHQEKETKNILSNNFDL